MQDPYIPASDGGFDVWFANFNAVAQASAAAYGLSAAQASAIQTAFDLWHDAYVVATTPATRTKPSVAAKDAQRAAAVTFIRPIAIRIKNDLGITNEQKLAIGVNLPNSERSPIAPPSSNPLLDVIGATFGVHTLRFSDSNTPASRRKPFGALAMQLWRAIGVAPASDPEQAEFVDHVTRQPLAVNYSASENGKVATYFGRWITRTGEIGPWSPPVSFTIAA